MLAEIFGGVDTPRVKKEKEEKGLLMFVKSSNGGVQD